MSLNHYRRAGYLPEAILNYLGLMGFAMPDGRDEFTLEEFVAALDLEKIALGGPVFDLEKLTWFNGRYLRRLSPNELLGRLRGHVLGDEYLLRVLPLVQERIDTLEAFSEYASFFFVGELAYDEAALAAMVSKGRTAVEVGKALSQLVDVHVDPLVDWTAETFESALVAFGEASGWASKETFMVVRVALTGRAATPPLFETAAVLGKEICRRRLRRAASVLGGTKRC